MARIYTNFAKSTLASGIAPAATSITVAAGEGALFPAAGAGSTFDAVIYNSAAQREIVSCTSRTGDVLTVTRAQQGTTALTWNAADKIGHRLTKDALNNIIFADNAQQNSFTWCGTAGGTANALTLTPSPAVSAMVAGHKFIFKSGAAANTTAVTIAVSGLATFAVQNNGVALVAGDIEASKWYEVLYEGAAGQIKKYSLGINNAIVDAKGDLIVGTAADTVARLAVGANQTLPEADSTQTTGLIWVNRPDYGQAQLTYTDTTHIKLIPFNGNKLVVNGVVCTVPDAGVSYAISGLAANTLYYVYDVATAGVITSLELSTTVPVASTTAGNKGTMIKTGDDTRSLVGMVRTDGSTLFADTVLQRFVRSWFNDSGVALLGVLGSDVALSVSGGPWAKVSNNAKLEFLAWANEFGHADISASWYDSTGGVGQLFYAGIGLNSETTPGSTPYGIINYDTTGYYKNSATNRSDKLAVGYNYYAMIYIIGGGSTPFLSAASGISAIVGRK